MLLVQAPVIAGLIVLIWQDVDEVTDSLLFVLTLSAIWFGTLNSCREVVKEKAIFEREWMKGVQVWSYLASKLAVLSLLGFAQCLCLVFIVNSKIDLGDPPIFHLFVLFAASLAGTGLGILISAAMNTPDQSLAAVPIFLIPQILFSELLLSHDNSSDIVKFLDNLAITTWSYEGLKTLEETERSWGTLFSSLFVPILMCATFLGIAFVLMRLRLPGLNKAKKKKTSK